jgi:hypothetical protein
MAYGEKDPKMAVDYAQDFVNDWGREDIFHWQGILIMAAAYIDRQEPDKALSSSRTPSAARRRTSGTRRSSIKDRPSWR